MTYKKNYKARFQPHELNTRVKDIVDELAKATDEAKMSKQMLDYLELCTKLYQYSAHNQWLILSQRPDATHCASRTVWNGLGRWISGGKGCGIAILCPMFYEDEETGTTKMRFRVGYTFDISDTDGEELPEQPKWKSPEKSKELHERLMSFASKNGIKVTIAPLPGDCQGMSSKGKITLSPEAGTKTFVHELAHELMHWDEEGHNISSRLKELEAESVAYVVAKHVGLNDLGSMNYIALHGADGQLILAHMGRIQKMAKKIILHIEGKEDKYAKTNERTNQEIAEPVGTIA